MTGYEPTPELIEAAAKAIFAEQRRHHMGMDALLPVDIAEACLAVVVPLIREQIAAEIENLPRLRDSYAYTYHDGTRDAARVARGED